MIDLVTIEQAKRHLRLDVTPVTGSTGSPGSPPEDDQDLDLASKITQATAIVLDYIARPSDTAWTAEIDSWTTDLVPASGYTTVPPIIQAAVLLVLANLWRFRGDDPHGVAPVREHGFLTPDVVALLYRYRQQVVA